MVLEVILFRGSHHKRRLLLPFTGNTSRNPCVIPHIHREASVKVFQYGSRPLRGFANTYSGMNVFEVWRDHMNMIQHCTVVYHESQSMD